MSDEGIDVNVTEAGDEGDPENTSCPALMSVAEIVFATFCVTGPKVSVRALATLMAALTLAVALTVEVIDVCAPTPVDSAAIETNARIRERQVTRSTEARESAVRMDERTK